MAEVPACCVFNPLFTTWTAARRADRRRLLRCCWLGLAYHAPRPAGVTLRRILCVIAVLDGFAWNRLTIRPALSPRCNGLAAAPIDEAELWAWSGGWLAWLRGDGAGYPTGSKSLRLAALGICRTVAARLS